METAGVVSVVTDTDFVKAALDSDRIVELDLVGTFDVQPSWLTRPCVPTATSTDAERKDLKAVERSITWR